MVNVEKIIGAVILWVGKKSKSLIGLRDFLIWLVGFFEGFFLLPFAAFPPNWCSC